MKIRIVLFLTTLLFISYSCKKLDDNNQITEKTEIRQWKPEDTRTITGVTSKRGLINKTDQATQGYVLFSPAFSTQTYLMDMDGNIVHSWTGELSTMLNGYLLESGHLIRLERDIDFPTFAAGGQAGRIREYDWDGNMVWDFEYANENELTHHDIEIMPNGNILAISYEVKSVEEAIEAGRDPEHIAKAGIWPDKIIEIKPTKPSGGEIVWEWHMWDHLIQDIDSTKQNYGVIADNPQKININIHAEGAPPMTQEQIDGMKKMGFATSNATIDNQTSDISHVNAIGYNSGLDQIVISIPHFSEIYIIDHSITTEEAKGSAGDLLYRWGNPGNYGRGTKEDQKLFGQHDIKWIPKGYPGEGNLMVFNNDIVNPDNKLPSVFAALMSGSPDPQVAIADIGNYSAVYELVPSTNDDGSYVLNENGVYGPSEPNWSYTAPDKYSMYSAFVSGAQRLKNGNTLITSGAKGRFIEVTPGNDIVWEYWNPYNFDHKLPDGSPAQPVGSFLYAQFRSTHFTTDFPAFKGKELK
ncbi:MAG: aryl-sulfate sulfotransferase, partial [Flavobacteriaceae bacterium]|nr:aryl-sulfate sulfotransferase [Flavobacteriaceae bacterium]